MQIAANASVNNNLSMWATSAPAPKSAQPTSDPLSPQDTVTLSNPPDTPEHAPTFAPADIEPDIRAGTAGPYNPSVQTELKKEDHFLDKQQSEGRHFVKLDQDGSRIGFASKNINGDNVLYTGQATGNAGHDGGWHVEIRQGGRWPHYPHELSNNPACAHAVQPEQRRHTSIHESPVRRLHGGQSGSLRS